MAVTTIVMILLTALGLKSCQSFRLKRNLYCALCPQIYAPTALAVKSYQMNVKQTG